MDKTELKMLLSQLNGFEDPDVSKEQYMTTPEIAATLLHYVNLCGDIEGNKVIDLGAGTGILGIGAAVLGAKLVLCVEEDKKALKIAQKNLKGVEEKLERELAVNLLQADVNTLDMKNQFATAIMNPPFGLKRRDENLVFLKQAITCADTTYCLLHSPSKNEGRTRKFIKEFLSKEQAKIVDVSDLNFPLKHSYPFHTQDKVEIKTKLYKIVSLKD